MAIEPLSAKKIIRANVLLAALVTGLFFLNVYHQTIFYRPTSYHQWRQADCLSIAKNYYEEGMRFFRPVIHYQGVEGGRAVGECPILNYSGAALWKIFGEHEFVYRLMVYLMFLAAVAALFNTLLRHTRSWWFSLFVTSVMLTSPLLVYYSLNFMSDVPALSMAVISFCALYHFMATGRWRFYYISVIIGTLGVLMKASALIPLCLALLAGLAALAGRVKTAVLLRRWPVLLSLILPVALIFAWYRFAIVYNDFDTNNIFLLTVLPVWEMDQQEILHKLKILFNVQFPLLLNRPMFFLVFACAAFVISRFRILEPLLKWAFVVSGIYFIVYILFFFWVFDVHDYYLINIIIFPVITFFCTAIVLSRPGNQLVNNTFAVLFIPMLIVFNGFHASAIYRLRMINGDPMLGWFPFVTKEEIAFAEYLFWDNSQDVKRVEHFGPVLRAHGIDRTDFVLSIPDHSFNVTLYLMDQKGFTVARDHIKNDTTVMDRFMKKVDYIVLSDTTLQNEIAFRRMEHNFSHYFTHGPVKVYKMNHVR